MGAARKLGPQADLSLYAPVSELDPLYEHWLLKTGSPEAAATLVLATVQAGEHASGQSQASAAKAKSAPACDSTQLDSREYLTIKQAAQKYNLGERTIYRMVEEGLPVTRAGRAIRIRPRDLAKRLADSETILR